MKKSILSKAAFLLSALMVLSFTACTNNQSDKPISNTPSSKAEAVESKIEKKEKKLSICTVSKPHIKDMETNEFTIYMEKQTGINVDWSTVPLNNLQEKVQLILSSGNLPDVFMSCGLTTANITRYGVDEKLFIPLDDYIKNNAPNLQEALSKSGGMDMLNVIRQTDGKIYSMPQLDKCTHCEHARKMWLYDPWMKKLGLKYPTTTQEFENVLRAFKDKDPNGNGKPDEIPLSASTNGYGAQFGNYLLNAFVYYDFMDKDPNSKGMYLEDGKIKSCLATDEYKQGLQWINSLYKQGLLYENALTQDKAAAKAIAGGDVALVGAAAAGTPGGVTGGKRQWEYRPVEPLKGPNGVKQSPVYPSYVTDGNYVVTKSCKNVEAAVQYADFMYQQTPSLWTKVGGPEGVNWQKAKEGELDYNGKPAVYSVLKPWSTSEEQNVSWLDIGVFNFMDLRLQSSVKQDVNLWSTEGLEYMLYKKTIEMYKPYEVNKKVPPMPINIEYANKVAQLTTDLDKLVSSSQFNFVTGAYNFKTDWEKYLKDVSSLSDPLVEIYQKIYNSIYKK